MLTLSIAPLTKASFAPFGEVVETAGATVKPINDGFAHRFDDLARIDVAAEGGSINISLFTGAVRPNPIRIALMERHPLGSQLFAPMQARPWLVVVCGDPGDAATYRAFRATGRQGVNYARNVWHHPLLVLDEDSLFLVVDRTGPGNNLEEYELSAAERLSLAP